MEGNFVPAGEIKNRLRVFRKVEDAIGWERIGGVVSKATVASVGTSS